MDILPYTEIVMTFIWLLLLLLFGAMLLENLAAWQWLPDYFQKGFPVLTKKYSVPVQYNLDACADRLERKFRATFWRPSILFNPISANQCAFRTTLLEMRVGRRFELHGLLHLYPEKNLLLVTFRWRLSELLFYFLLIILAAGAILNQAWLFALFAVLLLIAAPIWRIVEMAYYADHMARAVRQCFGAITVAPPAEVERKVVAARPWISHLDRILLLGLFGLVYLIAMLLLPGKNDEPLYSLSHQDGVVSLAFSPDGSILASGSRDGAIYLWQTSGGTALARLEGHKGSIKSLVFSPDQTILASADTNGSVNVWQVSDGRLLHTLQEGRANRKYPPTLIFSGDGTVVAAAFSEQERNIKVWRVADGAFLGALKLDNVYSTPPAHTLFSPDGTLLAMTSWGVIEILRTEDGKLLRRLRDNGDQAHLVAAFSPDGSLLLSGSANGDVRLWRVADGAQLTTFQQWGRLKPEVKAVTFSPDGSIVAAAAGDRIRLWRVADGRALRTIKGQTGAEVITFSPDGLFLVAGNYLQQALLWEISR